MTSQVVTERAPDEELWGLVRQGSVSAFEAVVRRHQSAVAAVAYNACGDLALSEDVAQETFWAAWREPSALEQPGRLRAWLCGIARNLGKNAWRKASRTAGPIDGAAEPASGEPGPEEDAVSREDEALVWETLERVPESYREPLILFYREAQSVAEVAAALELSEDAVRQRLSRGRGILRDRLTAVVEEGLRRGRPGRKFTVAVVTGLTAHSAVVSTATAAGAAGAAKAVAGAGIAGGAVAGLLGPLVGLLGGWVGTRLPAELAPTRRERDALRRYGLRVMAASVVFTAVMFAAPFTLSGRLRPAYWPVWGVSFLTFQMFVIVSSVRAAGTVRRIRAEARPGDEPNDTAFRVRVNALTSRFRGRVYRSRVTLLGFPLIDVNVSDPFPTGGSGRRVARGWVAVGDDARGFLAVGGRSVGVLSFGGLAVGVVAVGGLAVGVVAVGGLGLGVYAAGGLAAGWQACGGGAIAWDVACGGGAVARHAAFGGAAFARDYALGGGGWARHFNDGAARAALLGHPLKRGLEWYVGHAARVAVGFVTLGLLTPCAVLPVMYRRERVE